ncbi:hypothetical protein [Candidatus Chromulinivorax destructor]|uniref:Uncharacterized protein n=1 Tax=Candidatus Chromulinivorax destructor TaxID=2066483 RepID=A0A345ZAB0_9BACT|nr:hypothetical protein [Candidatus Chromulinivorax destructor]AXK60227.1 hypothetical protein C0J27_00480 [Candidatus Chromulinivorax destructor]
MKSLMNKLAMVAVVVALVIVGYMIVQRQGAVQGVKIQGKLKDKAGNKADSNKKDSGNDCTLDAQCKSGSCVDSFCS